MIIVKKQDNFLKYLEEKYGDTFKVHSYNQFVQLSNKSEDRETLNFHFDKKGFFDGAFYKEKLISKGVGASLLSYSKESGKYGVSTPKMIDSLQKVYDEIAIEMDFNKVLENLNKRYSKEAVKSFVVKLDRKNVFAFNDKTFVSSDVLTQKNIENIQNIKGMDAIPLDKTEYKDREVFECKASNKVLLVDTKGFKGFLERINNNEKVAEAIVENFPDISYDEAMGVINEVLGIGKDEYDDREHIRDDEMEMDL